MASLPSHQHLLTSLLNSISDIVPQTANPAPSSPQSAPRRPVPPTSCPLQSIPEPQRPLLLTLHVLFPNLLLPAFDLLDRGLVIRLCREKTDVPSGEDHDAGLIAAVNHDNDGADVFIVHSIATTMNRRGRNRPPSSQYHIVHLRAWNCSCASFTVDRFRSHARPNLGQDVVPERHKSKLKWPFGELGSYESFVDDVPCCKHLLACLLAIKWPGMVGHDVQNRSITRDELAGIMAEM